MPNEIKGILDAFLNQSTPKTNTNLDLENSYDLGGPINDEASGFEQKYTPTNPYYTTNEGIIHPASILMIKVFPGAVASEVVLPTPEAPYIKILAP
jgi:hypothetical protein